MKKVFVLMMMVVAMMIGFVGCATTAPANTGVSIDFGDWFVATNSDNTPVYFDEFSDDRKVEIYKSFAPEEINGKRLVYEGFEFSKVDRIAEKYYTYFFVKKDETYIVLVNNIGDGRELSLYYRLEDIVE